VPTIVTNTETNAPAALPVAKLEVTNSPPPAMPTNPVVKTNAVSAPAEVSTEHTNEVALTAEDSGLGGGGALAVGAVFLVAAVGLAVFIARRSRKAAHVSLITRSMVEK